MKLENIRYWWWSFNSGLDTSWAWWPRERSWRGRRSSWTTATRCPRPRAGISTSGLFTSAGTGAGPRRESGSGWRTTPGWPGSLWLSRRLRPRSEDQSLTRRSIKQLRLPSEHALSSSIYVVSFRKPGKGTKRASFLSVRKTAKDRHLQS